MGREHDWARIGAKVEAMDPEAMAGLGAGLVGRRSLTSAAQPDSAARAGPGSEP